MIKLTYKVLAGYQGLLTPVLSLAVQYVLQATNTGVRRYTCVVRVWVAPGTIVQYEVKSVPGEQANCR